MNRTKRIYLHANPLFEKWLIEWRNEAAKKNSNLKYNYQRAIKSLKKYPLPLYSGKDCSILTYFGDKLCKLIDNKIEEFVKENGPIDWDDYIKVKDFRKPAANSKKKGKISSTAAKTKANSPSPKILGANQEAENSEKKERKRGKQYLPAYRSGAYGLLLALHYASNSPDYDGFLRKPQLLKEAQEFCDASYTVPPDGSHYTAWSSMSNLIKKKLVERSSCPSKYSLTAEGVSLASLLVSKNAVPTPSSSHSSSIEGKPISASQTSNYDEIVHQISSSDEEEQPCDVTEEISLISDDDDLMKQDLIQNNYHSAPLPAVSLPPKQDDLFFTYVNDAGLETPVKDNSYVKIDENSGRLLFLIKAKLLELFNSDLDYQLDDGRAAPPGYTYALLADECAPDYSSGLDRHHESRPTTVTGTARSTAAEHVRLSKETVMNSNSCKNTVKKKEISLSQDSGCLQARKRLPKKTGEGKDEKGLMKRSNSDVVTTKRLKKDDAITILPTIEETGSNSQDKILFTLKPGTFRVVLCVDNTEVFGGATGKRNGTKEIIKDELLRHGVHFQVRNLNVGDFLWTCRGIASSGEESEVVLPFVVERKRMDDLAHSIRDGRFREQKFRLKLSGLSQPIYLVEEFGSAHARMPVNVYEQAITNTQIVDGFNVKLTKDQKESAAYLTIMTRYLQGKFGNKTIHCVSSSSSSDPKDWESSELCLRSFREVNVASAKNRPLCLRDTFAKHLLQLFGASVDKVTAIVDKYKTPHALIEALESAPSHERENLLTELKCRKSGRVIDQNVSSQIARLFTWETLL